MGPWMLSAGDRACRGARCVRQALDRLFNASDLRFPGFFVHRFDASALLPPYVSGVPDNTWVEVLRVARIETHFGNSSCTAGQVWFWLAMGSGIWWNTGRSLRGENPGCGEARRRGFDSIQLLRSFNGYSYELVDCRGAEAPGASRRWESACPPPHVELRAGAPPRPYFAPALAEGLPAEAARRSSACLCDQSRYHLNCYLRAAGDDSEHRS